MEPTRTSTLGRIVRRHGWIICLGLVMGTVSAGIALSRSGPVYSSAASVLVLSIGQGEVNLQTEAELVRSTETAVEVASRLGGPVPSVSSVAVVPNTSVLLIRFEAATPAAAQAGARAFAEAYLANRAEAAAAAVTEQVASLNAKVSELDAQSADLNARIATLPKDSPELATLRGTLATVSAQSAALLSRANELATTTINPGRVIDEADRPTAPTRPQGWLYFGAGAAGGAVLALIAAVIRDQLSRRVRHGADVAVRSGLTLLAELPGDPGETDGAGSVPARLLPPHHPAGRAFHRLRNEVVALLGPDDRALLVTAVSPGPASTVVAANLAAALARADNEVILVGANVPEIGSTAVTLARLFDVADIPGLTDVLARRTALASAVQRAARTPRLRVVTPGGTASAGGLLQSEGVRTAIAALRRQARYLVLDAPSTASGADAQSLAGAADAAILVVEAGQARHAQVIDAAVQFGRIGIRLLGAVVLPQVLVAEPEIHEFRHRAEDMDDHAGDTWLNDLRDAMNAPTTAVKQIEPTRAEPTRPATPAQS